MVEFASDTAQSAVSQRSTAGKAIGLVFFLVICIAAMIAGALVTTPNVTTWYRELTQPSWTPPPWLFGPVWSALYVTMAISAWLVWKDGEPSRIRWPLTLFGIQLILNVAWSWLFFGMKSPGLALIEIVALLVAIFCTMISFWKVSRAASVLLMPYFAWVIFAASLNAGFWWLN